jgi:HEAT repeat protein
VINNLITTMTLDPSANVRLNAVEALYAHADDPLVKAAVVSSLTHEASPIVQLALIDFVVGAHDHEAIPELQKLLSSEQTDTNVRDAAKTAIPQL